MALADYLSADDLDTRLKSLLLINTTAYGHWDATRRYILLNDAQFEVYKLILDTFDEIYFVALKESITPGNSTEINLDTGLDPTKPFYRLISFEKQVGSVWRPVVLVGPREAWRKSATVPETWYVLGRKLKTDSSVSGTYRVAYHYRIPKLVNAGDVSEIPPEFAEMVPVFAAKMAALQSRQSNDAVFFDGESEKRKREMQKAAHNRILAKQNSVLDVEGYGGDGRPASGIYIVT